MPISIPQSGLWANHPASTTQQRRHGEQAQRNIMLFLFRHGRLTGVPPDVPTILSMHSARDSARIAEFREAGFGIESRMERVHGVLPSSYVSVHDPERDDPAVKP